MILGAILAGGASRRFGSDKALALLDNRPLIDHVAAAVAGQVDALVVCGRTHKGLVALPDRPAPGLGPLGGLGAALAHGRQAGFAAVLSVGCDMPLLPPDLVALLSPGPGALENQWLVGLWPVTLADRLDAFVTGKDRSLRGWAVVAGARLVTGPALPNINTPADLAGLSEA